MSLELGRETTQGHRKHRSAGSTGPVQSFQRGGVGTPGRSLNVEAHPHGVGLGFDSEGFVPFVRSERLVNSLSQRDVFFAVPVRSFLSGNDHDATFHPKKSSTQQSTEGLLDGMRHLCTGIVTWSSISHSAHLGN